MFTDISKEDMLRSIVHRDNQNLEINVNDEDSIVVTNWYYGDYYKIEQIQTSDDFILSSKKVQLLIDAMATFTDITGMDVNTAIKTNNEEYKSMVEQFWVKANS